MAKEEITILVEDAKVKFLNFEGREGPYNRSGSRSFVVEFDEDTSNQLLAEGWNVKMKPDYYDEEKMVGNLQVAVEFENFPPRIFVLTNEGKNRVLLDTDTVGSLDSADMATLDIIIRAYDWEVNDKTGRKAYLKTAYATVVEDELDRKYAQQ